MTLWYYWLIAFACLLTLEALFWCRSTVRRLGLVVLFGGLLGLGYGAFADLLSRPKPVAHAWSESPAREAAVLGFSLREDEGIYILLQTPTDPIPGYYRYPWDPKLAEQLQEAQRRAEREGSQVLMGDPFEPSWDRGEKRFYVAPQPKLPDKPGGPPPKPAGRSA